MKLIRPVWMSLKNHQMPKQCTVIYLWYTTWLLYTSLESYYGCNHLLPPSQRLWDKQKNYAAHATRWNMYWQLMQYQAEWLWTATEVSGFKISKQKWENWTRMLVFNSKTFYLCAVFPAHGRAFALNKVLREV